ncbi:MAG: class I SAM-dependent rRNA methyltransferase [Deltaproteobacteria bacterium]|nr:class I SAM-dependent rRNA methyltransferase [Deltaproteobacteria bacterium]
MDQTKKTGNSSAIVRKKVKITIPDMSAKAIQSGHPWIFRNVVAPEEQAFSTGDMVDVQDRDGRFIARGIWDNEGSVAIRVFTRDSNAPTGSDFFNMAVERAVSRRAAFTHGATNAYRLVNGESDRLPGISITRYDKWLHCILYTESAEKILDATKDQLMSIEGIAGIYVQNRFRPSGEKGNMPEPSRLYTGERAPLEFEIEEHGLRFMVDITAPMSTGFFPDYRPGRLEIGELSNSKRVLNLFSYTGAFSVYAYSSGASEVVSVDINQKVNNKAMQNCELNKVRFNRRDFLTEDAIKAVSQMAAKGRKFDLAIIDPPTFATGPRGNWSVHKNYRQLLREMCLVMDFDSKVLCTSNTQKMTGDEFERILASGWGIRPATILKRIALPEDYPELPGFSEGNYLKSMLLGLD